LNLISHGPTDYINAEKGVIPHTVMVTLNNTSLTYTAVESARGNSSFTYRTSQLSFFIHISRNYKVLLSSCPHLWK